MSDKKVFRVLACIDLSTEAGRQKLRGIYRFLGTGYDWDMSLLRSQKEFNETFQELVRVDSYDGFLIAIPQDAEKRRLHRELGTPTVFIDYVDIQLCRAFRKCVFIHDDDRDIGRAAAQHLMAQGTLASYGYAASNDMRPWNKNRGEQFAAALARHKITTSTLPATDTQPIESIVKWLQSMSPPIGILAAYDDTARRILDACHVAGYRVPDDVSILGIGNDELICLHTTPPLSSVIPDFNEEGYRAARELQALMLHKLIPTRREIPCGSKGIAARGTTAGGKNAALLVRQAVAFIKENAFEPITAADVVRHLRISRRLADLRFREVMGTSILAYITDLRLGKVRKLLETTDLRIGEIARQCGYDAANLKNLFARHYGISMRGYRQANRLPT